MLYGGRVPALEHINLTVEKGDWLAVMGPSGSGKTTLMNIIGCMDKHTSGEVILDGINLNEVSKNELTQIRRDKIGMVFQQFHLIPYLTAVENLMVAQYYHSIPDKKEAMEALARVGLEDRAGHLPSELSGGEQQRVCIARALINYPVLILADEPTGNLDEKNEKLVMNLSVNSMKRGIPSLPLPIPTMSAKRQNGSLSSSMDICVKEEKKKSMKNLKKYGAAAAAGLVAATLIGGCGDTKEAPASEGSTKSGLTQYKPPKVDTKGLLSKAKDGTFEGKSAANGEGEYSIISIMVKDHKITAATFDGFLKDGKRKGEDYGKTNGKIENKVYYNKAQLALKANKTYAEALLQKQELNKVDGISGATLSYKQFFDAAQRALEEAGK